MSTQEKLQRHLQFLEQDPDNINLLLSICACYQELDDWQSALLFIEKAEACALLPYSALLLKAQILLHLQQTDEALTFLTALSSHPESTAQVSGLLAILHFDAHDEAQAEFYSNEALKRDPDNYEGQLVRILLKTLHYAANLDEMELLLTRHPSDGRLLFAIGATHLHQMNINKAEEAFLKVTEIWSDFYENWLSLGWCYLLKNDLDQALVVFQKAIRLSPDIADGLAGLALVYALQENKSEAQQWLDKALELDHTCELAALTRIILDNESNPKEAARQFNRLFPQAQSDINKMLMISLLSNMSSEGRTIH